MLIDCFVSVLGGRLFNLAFRGGRIRVGERGDAHLPRETRPPADAALPQHCRTTNLQVTFYPIVICQVPFWGLFDVRVAKDLNGM